MSGSTHVLAALLEAPNAKRVCLAETILSLGDADRSLRSGELADDLDRRLGLLTRAGAAARALIVKAPGVRAALYTTAAVRLVELPAKAFWRLPRMLREAGCAGWVAGVVDITSVPSGPAELAPWIDLRALVLELAGAAPAAPAVT